MIFSRLLIGGLLIATLLACTRTSPSLSAADSAAIKGSFPQWSQAVVSGDLDVAATLMTNDVWFSIPNQAPIVGRDSAIAWMKTWPRIIGQEWHVEEVGGTGDIAFARAMVIETYQLAGSSPISEHQACLSVARRQPGGAWQFSHISCLSIEPGSSTSH